MKTLLALFLSLAPIATAMAGACCGGGNGLPQLILGDFRSQFSLGLSDSENLATVGEDGRSRFYDGRQNDHIQTFQLDGAYQLSDYWQAGVGVPIKRRERSLRGGNEETSSGLGDVAFSTAYEWLSDHAYSAWRPRGFVFFKLTAPTSPSIHDSKRALQTDNRGSGFWMPGMGMAFYRIWGELDVLAMAEGHHGIKRDFGEQEISPGWGGSALLGAGLSPAQGKWRLGLEWSPKYEGEKRTTTRLQTITNSSQYYVDARAVVSYAFQTTQALAVFYNDQTLFGPAKTTSVGRSFGLSFMQRFAY